MALSVTAFTDFVCPFSYVTEAGLWARRESADLEIVYRALELYPAPAEAVAPDRENGLWERLEPLARAAGVELGLPNFRPRTRKAHEAALYAAEHDAGPDMRAALYESYWRDERDIGRIDVLVDIAEGLGLEGESLKIALDIDRYAERIDGDRELAARLRVTGVPVVYVGSGPEARALIGAHGPSALDEVFANR